MVDLNPNQGIFNLGDFRTLRGKIEFLKKPDIGKFVMGRRG